jgi:hypothetical protein
MLSKISWPNLQSEIFYSFHLGFNVVHEHKPFLRWFTQVELLSFIITFEPLSSSHVVFPIFHLGFNFVHEHKPFLRWFTQVELLSFIIITFEPLSSSHVVPQWAKKNDTDPPLFLPSPPLPNFWTHSRTCNLRNSSPNLVLDPQDWKKHEYIYYPSLGHSRTIGFKWTWVVGIITYLVEGRGGRGWERRGGPPPNLPPKVLSNSSDQKMPLYIWRGATMSKQTTNKPAKRSQVLHDHKE